MAAWRRKALKRFPELRRDLNAPDYSIYQLFFDLLPMVREGHRDHNCEVLRRIYGFADWCIQQKTKEPLNAAVVAFYEHLFDEPCLWDDITQWLTPLAIEGCLPCWEARLRPRQFGRLQKLLKGRRRIRYHEYTLTRCFSRDGSGCWLAIIARFGKVGGGCRLAFAAVRLNTRVGQTGLDRRE